MTWYTKLDAECDKQATVAGGLFTTPDNGRRAAVTAPWPNFSKYRVRDKVQEESTFIF